MKIEELMSIASEFLETSPDNYIKKKMLYLRNL